MTERVPLCDRRPEVQKLWKYFDYAHLPPHLQRVSRHYAVMVDVLMGMLPDSPELTVAIRKLLESKDCAVRAALDLPQEPDDSP